MGKARVVSVGRDRSTGQAVLRFRDEKGRLVDARLRPQQFRTLEEAAGSDRRDGMNADSPVAADSKLCL